MTATPQTTDPATALSPIELAAWRGLLRTYAELVKALDADLVEAHGLPLTSYEVLLFLDAAPGNRMRMRDLADSVLLSRSGLTRLVDRLVRTGWVERSTCSEDGRGAFAQLTDAGREVLHEARPTHLNGIRRRFLALLSESELEQLAATWERLVPGAASA